MEEVRYLIEEVAKFLDRPAGIINRDGMVVVSTDKSEEGGHDASYAGLGEIGETPVSAGERTYAVLEHTDIGAFAAYVKGTDDTSRNYLELIVRYLKSELKERDSEAGRLAFLKNVLLENELPGDIPLKAREHKVLYSARRQAVLLHFEDGDAQAYVQTLKDTLQSWGKDYILPMDEENIVILLELEDGEKQSESIDQLAQRIFDTLSEDDMTKLYIGIGLPAETLKDTAKSYREASLALTVGSIFESESYIMRYDKLGLGRLIYQLPPTLCHMFLSEVFRPGAYEALDTETLLTIQKFFENNLNGSETSRQLFVHRNTLVYRLDKVQKITGLDLRNFDDAVLFKLAAMVRKYLEKQGAAFAGGGKW
ncbi:MAG TPA: PucR family transcriptional regulator [Clostridiaceae bacterium]|jgi:carbohydrate diacid regulator|nr:PucR family transcriptional regulator [Clostridiaceae bacterium]